MPGKVCQRWPMYDRAVMGWANPSKGRGRVSPVLASVGRMGIGVTVSNLTHQACERGDYPQAAVTICDHTLPCPEL